MLCKSVYSEPNQKQGWTGVVWHGELDRGRWGVGGRVRGADNFTIRLYSYFYFYSKIPEKRLIPNFTPCKD